MQATPQTTPQTTTQTTPLSKLELPCAVSDLAIFLDFDGTLADIVDHPDDVVLLPAARAAIVRLVERTSGAVAVVTGRPIEQIDALFDPLVLPVAGVHGMMRRDHAGALTRSDHDPALFAEAQARLTRLHLANPDTMLEVKPGSLALHYRRRPDLAETIAASVHEALGDLEGLDLLHGKMVLEVKAGHADKGSAIRAFMDETPFAGRLPLFAGDDVTDEFGFRAIDPAGGISIKIGQGPTAARYNASDTVAFRAWLSALAASSA